MTDMTKETSNKDKAKKRIPFTIVDIIDAFASFYAESDDTGPYANKPKFDDYEDTLEYARQIAKSVINKYGAGLLKYANQANEGRKENAAVNDNSNSDLIESVSRIMNRLSSRNDLERIKLALEWGLIDIDDAKEREGLYDYLDIDGILQDFEEAVKTKDYEASSDSKSNHKTEQSSEDLEQEDNKTCYHECLAKDAYGLPIATFKIRDANGYRTGCIQNILF